MKNLLLAILTLSIFSTTAFAEILNKEDVQLLLQKIPPGQYQGISDEGNVCTISVSFNETEGSYSVDIAPPRGGGQMPAAFSVRPGQEAMTAPSLISISHEESSFMLISAPNGYKSMTVINRKGAERAYALCRLK
jgi:hypothetical protein